MSIVRGPSTLMKGEKVKNLFMLIGEPIIVEVVNEEPMCEKFHYNEKKWVNVSDRNNSTGRSKDSKKAVEKTNVTSTSYLIEEDVEDKKIEAYIRR